MRLPSNEKQLTKLAVQLRDDCLISLGQRSSAYRQYGQWLETGRAAGGLALANLLYGHVDRLASHLCSPEDLRFTIDFEREYDAFWHQRAAVVAKVIRRAWKRRRVDLKFGLGVFVALAYGACALKQLCRHHSDGSFEYGGATLVPPWRMGLYNEAVNDLDEQEVILERTWLTRAQVWRRVRTLPDPVKLFKKIIATSDKESGVGTPTSFMHQVLSTAVLNTSLQTMTQPQPGGIVQLSNDPNFALLGPQVSAELFPMDELWVKDDDRGGEDYTTIQMFSPDIMVAPLLKHCNLFVKDVQPYTLIQPNEVLDYAWGRSEIVDLMQLQEWLTTHLDDIKRLTGLQVDKILGFEGLDAISDEVYGQLTRTPGFMGVPQGTTIKDLTPQIPQNMAEVARLIIELMNMASGFPPIMSGQGEPGVRAGVHADTLMKTGSPRLRDRALLIETQINAAADTTLCAFEAKDASGYWTDPNVTTSDFTLKQLMDDRMISVDAHSGSPIYHDDHANLLAWGVKAGIITGESAIEQLPYNHKDILLHRLKEKEKAEQKMLEIYGPEILTGKKSHKG